MDPRFIRSEANDHRKDRGDLRDSDAWIDRNPRWDQNIVRFFPVGVNPNTDPRYLNEP